MACKQTETFVFDGGEASPAPAFSIMGPAPGPANFVGYADASDAISRFALGVSASEAAPNKPVVLITRGRATVQLAAALVPLKGQRIWLSDTTPGIGTNVAPGTLTTIVGIILGTDDYATNQTVDAWVSPEYAPVP